MCTHHIDDYEWFIRADDDVYIRVDRLKQFLTTIDNDQMVRRLDFHFCFLLSAIDFVDQLVLQLVLYVM